MEARNVISMLKGMPWLLHGLEDAATAAAAKERGHLPPEKRPMAHGRGRGQGSWVLVLMAFVMSGRVDMQPWWRSVKGDLGFWRLCGFDVYVPRGKQDPKVEKQPPSYQSLWRCLTELEDMADAFNDAAAVLMQKAHAQDPRVGAWWHIDASESETNATPIHDCNPGEGCPYENEKGPRVKRMVTAVAAEFRREETELAAEADELGTAAPAPKPVYRKGHKQSRVASKVIDHQRRGVRSYSNGHYYFCRDIDAGVRSYTSPQRVTTFWTGYFTDLMTDHFTGLPLAIHVFPADRSELKEYPVAFAKAEKNVGDIPKLVAGDRGLSFSEVFEHNTRRGVGSVIQFRRRSNDPLKTVATSIFDEHGIPTCKHCGGLTDYVRFRHDDGPRKNRPRLWLQCAFPITNACEKEQAISCSANWRRLVPVWRTHAAYHAMRQSHQRYEGKHQALRSNYQIAPNSYAIRPKRIGMKWQQLRANVALLIEWLRYEIQGGLRYLDVVETSGRGVRYGIAARRADLGLAGGGIAASAADPKPTRKWPPGSTGSAA